MCLSVLLAAAAVHVAAVQAVNGLGLLQVVDNAQVEVYGKEK